MRGLTKVPAQLCGDDRAVISVRPAARPASFWNVLPPAEQADLAAAAAGSWNGQNCTIVLIDIANFGTRTRNDRDRRRIRVVLYQISQSLFENPDRQHDYHREDRGDEILLIIPPHVPTSSVVDRILDNLATPLCRYNSTAAPATRIQMRVALHVGPVVSDAHGVDGLAIIHASRLLDASALRRHLAETGADLGFITHPSCTTPSSSPTRDPSTLRPTGS
jgi:class 3 adenylate cyclase